jgi:hypothetical protein
MSAALNNVSPTDLVNNLDPDALAARLDELDAEAQALRVLLRSARARQAAQKRANQSGSQGKGVKNVAS